MNDLNAQQALWLTKYVRESWHFENGKVRVNGNITVTDKNLKELPLEFSSVTGIFKFKGCSSLESVKGFPEAAEIVFEDCLFPAEIYFGAINEKKSLSDYLQDHFHEFETLHELILEHFPTISQKKSTLMKFVNKFDRFLNESLKDDVVNLYFKVFDTDEELIDTKELDKLIPSDLLENPELNYDQMFRKMNDQDLKKVQSYLKSLAAK